MSHEVTIIVSGPCGSGKSALLGEIEIMCKALSIPVRYADEKRAQADKNMNHADWTSELEMYKPSVVLVEDMPWLGAPASPAPTADSAADRDTDAYGPFLLWTSNHLGQGYSLEMEDGSFVDRVTRWSFVAYKAGIKRGQQDSAADVRRYHFVREADWDVLKTIYWSHGVQTSASREQSLIAFDAAIDAAMSTNTGEGK